MKQSEWKPINKNLFSWITTLNKIFTNSYLPELNGDLIYVLSDYGGDNKDSDFKIISILFVDVKYSGKWFDKQRDFRKIILPIERKMSFKNLNDKLRQNALVPFLINANEINGFCISFVIRKSIKKLISTNQTFDLFKNDSSFKGNWNPKMLEQVLRVSHFISFLIGGVSKPNQNIYWISDEDNIFANYKKTSDLSKIVSAFTSYYVSHNLGELGIGTTKIDEGDSIEEDLSSIPDLISGALSESITKLCNHYGNRLPKNLIFKYDGEFTSKTELIISWLFNNLFSLKKYVVLFDKPSNLEYSVSKFEMVE